MALPDWLESLALDTSYLQKMYSLPETQHQKELTDLDRKVLQSATKLLNAKPLEKFSGLITRSGSMAIHRTMAHLSKNHSRVALLSPAIDLYHAFADELNFQAQTYTVSVNDDLDIDSFIAFVKEKGCDAIFTAMPNNPTGTNLRPGDLEKLVSFCRKEDVTLVLDACFALVGKKSPFLSELYCLSDDLSWILLWDTGKTFGLRHRKIGLVWCSKNNESGIRNQIRNLEFEIPLAEKLFFIDVFSHAIKNDYISFFNRAIANNKNYIKNAFSLCVPEYGSFVALELPEGMTPENLVEETGVGVIDWNTFLPTTADTPTNRIRLCIARDIDTIKDGMKRLCDYTP